MKSTWMMGVAAAAGLALTAGCQEPELERTSATEWQTQQEQEGLGGAGTTGMQQQEQQAQQPQAQQQQEQTVIGRVASVSENELIVQDTYKKAHKLAINDQTQIIGTGQGLSAQPQLLQGLDVRVSFSGEEGQQVAKKVEVVRAETGGQQQQPSQQQQPNQQKQ